MLLLIETPPTVVLKVSHYDSLLRFSMTLVSDNRKKIFHVPIFLMFIQLCDTLQPDPFLLCHVLYAVMFDKVFQLCYHLFGGKESCWNGCVIWTILYCVALFAFPLVVFGRLWSSTLAFPSNRRMHLLWGSELKQGKFKHKPNAYNLAYRESTCIAFMGIDLPCR